MAELPGIGSEQVTRPVPKQPGDAPQPSPEHIAAIEAKWADMASIKPALIELIDVINRHPELLEWAKASKAGTLRVN